MTKKNVEKLAEKVLKKNGLSIGCPKCGHSLLMEPFWFDCHGGSYRICPNCHEIIY